MVACEAKDGKRQRHPVSVAARISSTADHETPPRPSARYAMRLLNTLNDRLRTSTALPWSTPWIHSAADLRTKGGRSKTAPLGAAIAGRNAIESAQSLQQKVSGRVRVPEFAFIA